MPLPSFDITTHNPSPQQSETNTDRRLEGEKSLYTQQNTTNHHQQLDTKTHQKKTKHLTLNQTKRNKKIAAETFALTETSLTPVTKKTIPKQK